MSSNRVEPLTGKAMPVAVVLGLTVNGLGVLRSLGPLGIECVGLHKGRYDFGRRSRYLRRGLAVSETATDAEIEEGVRQLTAGATRKPVLIPTEDRYAQFVALNQERLRQSFTLRCPPRELFEAFLDKAQTIALCKKHGVPIPVSLELGSKRELEEAIATLEFPAIVKPRLTFDQSFPGKNFVAQSKEALALFYRSRPHLLGRTVVQEIVPSGDGHILVVATYSAEDGKVVGVYTGRKLRQFLPDYGVTCFGVSESHPELARDVCSLLNGIGYRGFAALEFACDRNNGETYFLELNARTYYHNQLFGDAGVDLTRIGWAEMTGTVVPEAPVQRDGVHWLDLARDVRSFYRKKRQRQAHLGSWLRSLLRARSFAVFNPRDPIPAFFAALQLTADIMRHIAEADEDAGVQGSIHIADAGTPGPKDDG